MSGPVLNFPPGKAVDRAGLDEAPPIPIESRLVTAAIAAERARVAAEGIIGVLGMMPRDAGVALQASNALLDACFAANDAIHAYVSILECKGQA